MAHYTSTWTGAGKRLVPSQQSPTSPTVYVAIRIIITETIHDVLPNILDARDYFLFLQLLHITFRRLNATSNSLGLNLGTLLSVPRIYDI